MGEWGSGTSSLWVFRHEPPRRNARKAAKFVKEEGIKTAVRRVDAPVVGLGGLWRLWCAMLLGKGMEEAAP